MKMRVRAAGVGSLLLLLSSCGGDTVVLPKESPGIGPDATAKTSPTTTTPASGAAPTIHAFLTKSDGVAPLQVGFDLCKSTDARGGKDLDFKADLEGNGFVDTDCGFTHTYHSDGVNVYPTRLCAVDRQTKGQSCKDTPVKAYVAWSLSFDLKDCGGSPSITATLILGVGNSTRGGDVHSLAAVNKVEFQAVNLNTQATFPPIVQRTPATANEWTATWIGLTDAQVKTAGKNIRVQAIFSSRDGDNRPQLEKSGC